MTYEITMCLVKWILVWPDKHTWHGTQSLPCWKIVSLSRYWHLKIYMSGNWQQQILRVPPTTCVNNDIETGFNWYDFNLCCCFSLSLPLWQDTMPDDTNTRCQYQFIQYVCAIQYKIVAQLTHCSKSSPSFSVYNWHRLPGSGHTDHSDHRPPTKSFRAVSLSLLKSIEEVAIPAVDTASYRLLLLRLSYTSFTL